MWVKVCGTTTVEDALVAVEAGADAVGFVMVAASRRRVGADAVAAMGRALVAKGGRAAAVERVGVFDPRDFAGTGGVGGVASAIAREAAATELTGVQLHGGGGLGLVEVAEAVREAVEGRMTVLPVVSWEVGDAAAGQAVGEMLRHLRAVEMRRVLVDSKVGTEQGGTGVQFDWSAAAGVLEAAGAGMELVVAGGLRPETVGEAVRVLRPWGVDVVSGVEAEAGRKDAERVRAFVRAARGE